MADTVHLLPLSMSETCNEPEKSKRVVFHVDEVVGHSDVGVDQQSAEHCQEIGLKNSSQDERYGP